MFGSLAENILRFVFAGVSVCVWMLQLHLMKGRGAAAAEVSLVSAHDLQHSTARRA